MNVLCSLRQSSYFKGAKVVSKQEEAQIVYDALKSGVIKSKKVTDANNNNKSIKECLDRINEDIENILTFDSNDSDDENDDQQFGFSMLCTDDDDDNDSEENTKLKKNNRPAPPDWSLTINRKSNVINQTKMDHCVIDKFFGCEYEFVNMLDIFPKIHPKKAKRRKSSMKWDTPLRYSVIPKY